MFIIIGLVVVFGMVFGGYVLGEGKFDIILHAAPDELITIFGGAVGAFIMANSTLVLKKAGGGFVKALKGPKWKQDHYKDLLAMMFVLLKVYRTKGPVAIEPHIEDPENSKIFNHFPSVSGDHHVTDFICDYMRMMTMNFDDPHQMADSMDAELEKHHAEEHEPQHSLQTMADGLPAVGIIAAVLGVVKTMGAVTEPVEVLGGKIGGALVGTFMGIFLSYLIIAPVAGRLNQILNEEHQLFMVLKAIFIAHLNGQSPQVSIELGRKNVPTSLMPSFKDIEDLLAEIPPDLST